MTKRIWPVALALAIVGLAAGSGAWVALAVGDDGGDEPLLSGKGVDPPRPIYGDERRYYADAEPTAECITFTDGSVGCRDDADVIAEAEYFKLCRSAFLFKDCEVGMGVRSYTACRSGGSTRDSCSEDIRRASALLIAARAMRGEIKGMGSKEYLSSVERHYDPPAHP